MRYDPLVIDVHEDWHTPDMCEDMPSEADTPVLMFTKLISWCVHKNIMPMSIQIGGDD